MKPSSTLITVDPVNNFCHSSEAPSHCRAHIVLHCHQYQCCLKWKSRTLQRQPADDKPWMMMDGLVDSSVLHPRRYLNVLQCELSSFSFCHSFPLVTFSFLLSFSLFLLSFFAFLPPFPFSFFLVLPFSFASLPLASFSFLFVLLSPVLSSFFCFLFLLLLLLFLFQHIKIFLFS